MGRVLQLYAERHTRKTIVVKIAFEDSWMQMELQENEIILVVATRLMFGPSFVGTKVYLLHEDRPCRLRNVLPRQSFPL